MIVKYTTDIAAQIGMELSKVLLVDGKRLGCKDYHLLNISSKGRMGGALVHQDDLVRLLSGASTPRLELIIRRALLHLQELEDCDTITYDSGN
jgi:hypothetical protein